MSWLRPKPSNPDRKPPSCRSHQRLSETTRIAEGPACRKEGQPRTSETSRDAAGLGVGEAQRGEDHDRRKGSDQEDGDA